MDEGGEGAVCSLQLLVDSWGVLLNCAVETVMMQFIDKGAMD